MEQLYTKDGDLFFYREKEIDFINERIKNLTHNVSNKTTENISAIPSVMYFYGVGGLGKTSLIYQIKNKAQKEKETDIAVVSIDFENQDIYTKDASKEHLIREIVKQLGIVDFQFTTEDVNSEAEAIGIKISNYLKDAKKSNPIVLLFDSLESVNIEDFKWLQEKLIAPLVDKGQILIAYAGRKKAQESDLYFPWSIRRHLKYFPLEPFTEKQTKEHLGTLLKSKAVVEIPPNIMEITAGVPGLNKAVAKLIIANPESHDLIGYSTTEISTDKNKQDYIKSVVETEIFTDKNDIQFYKEDLTYISVLRQFDNRLLDYLIKELSWRKYAEENIRSEMTLIQKMLATTLLENASDGYGYVFAVNYRRIVDTYFRKSKGKLHFTLNVLCYKWYMKEVQDGDWVALADQIYYLVSIWYDLDQDSSLKIEVNDDSMDNTLLNPSNRRETLINLLNSKIEELKDKNSSRLFKIVNKIKRVLDGEEFSWFMSQVEIDELKNVCDKFINKYSE